MNQRNYQPPLTYPEAQTVVTVTAATLLDTNTHVCEVCYQGFPRLQNLIFHLKTHNRVVSFKRKTTNDEPRIRKVYLCPEPTCVHHNRSHALGDFAGLKKHYLRKHSTDRHYKCNKCSKAYAVASDLSAHIRICGERKYKCACGAQFSSHGTFDFHMENCDSRECEGAVKDSSISNTENSPVRSNSNSSLIDSTSSLQPTFTMGDGPIRSNSNNNNNTRSLTSSTTSILPMFDNFENNINSNLIGSTTSPMLTFDMEPNLFEGTNNSYLSITTNQSQPYHFATDQESRVTDPSMSLNLGELQPDFFPTFTTQRSHHGLIQENFDMWLYTNLMMNNIPSNNVTLDDINFMAYDGNYGRSSSLTDAHNDAFWGQEHSASQHCLNMNSIGSTSGNIISDMVQDFPTSYSSNPVEFSTQQEHNIFYGNSELAWNEHLTFPACGINNGSNMVQGYVSSSLSSDACGFMTKPLEQNVVFGSNFEPIGIADNGGSNPFMNPISGNGVGSSFFNQDIGGDYQTDAYGYHDLYGAGSSHFEYAGGHRKGSSI